MENQILRTEYVQGSGGYRCLFFRKKGTYVLHRQRDCEYIADEDYYVIQWEGVPEYDSGYAAWHFPPTEEGLKEAQAKMDAWP